MCWRSASEYRLYVGVSSKPVRIIPKPSRSLVGMLRDLLRLRQPQEAAAQVVPFPVGGQHGIARAVDRQGPEAA
jgi:hypothetical protein